MELVLETVFLSTGCFRNLEFSVEKGISMTIDFENT